MRGVSVPLWLIGRLTGLRLSHLLGLAIALSVALGGMGLLFWWLGEQADAAIGAVGFAIVALAYLYAATLLLACAGLLVARRVRGRIRRLFA